MRVLISEFLCGGGGSAKGFPASLATEGRAMLEAIVADFSRVPDVQVLTTWDARLLPPPVYDSSVEVHLIHTPDEEVATLHRLSREVDAALIIAPEIEGELYGRCERMRQENVRLLNCSKEAISLCSDKLRFSQFCSKVGVRTIPTFVPEIEPDNFPVIVKRRDGAGCLEMQQLKSPTAWDKWNKQAETLQFIVQPVISGAACSVGGLFRDGEIISVLPLAEQHLDLHDQVHYRGGRIPASVGSVESVRPVVHQMAKMIPGLNGYVGFDFVIPDSSPPVLVEINPRLCTSYLGYRNIIQKNLAEIWLNGIPGEKLSISGSFSFRADGSYAGEEV